MNTVQGRTFLVALFNASLLLACSGHGSAEIGASDNPGSDQNATEPAPTGGGGAPSADASTPSKGNGGSDNVGATPDAGAPSQGDAATAPDAPGQQAPDVDSIAWQTGTDVGVGIASKDTQNPAGNDVFIAYAAYGVPLAGAEAWATALYRASLAAHGVRYIYAVQGPSNPQYSQTEIGNTHIISAMVPELTGKTSNVIVLAHAAGTLVAHELFAELAEGVDPTNVAMRRIVYFNLDGAGDGLNATSVSYLKRAYFVGAHSMSTGTSSTNAQSMQSLGTTYANAGGYIELDATAAGCQAGGLGCMHMTPITTKPHDPANADLGKDYTDFVNRPVCHAFIESKAVEAGL